MILEIIPDTDSRLHTRVPDYDFTSQSPEDRAEVYKDLFHTFTVMGAYGLAANQCGLLHRVFVLRDGEEFLVCFNPSFEIVGEETAIDTEGCLSFPDLWLDIRRPLKIEAKWQSFTGEHHTRVFEEHQARGFIHETEHLNGVVFTSHVSKLKLDMAKKKRNKK
jgi:peptide deformylase